jgi:hypothetical protein
MNPRAHHRDGQPVAIYVIHVCPSADGYRATVREAEQDQLDPRTVRAGAAGHGTAATAPAAILAALIAARIPALTDAPRQP